MFINQQFGPMASIIALTETRSDAFLIWSIARECRAQLARESGRTRTLRNSTTPSPDLVQEPATFQKPAGEASQEPAHLAEH